MDETWQAPLINSIRQHLLRHQLLNHGVDNTFPTDGTCHLVIILEPYISRLLNGTKTIESRFCRMRKEPFEMVRPGDTLILKHSCGPVAGLCKVSHAIYHDLQQFPLYKVRQQYGQAIAVSDERFWKYNETARYVSLFCVSHVTSLRPIPCFKRDRRAWVVMREQLCGC